MSLYFHVAIVYLLILLCTTIYHKNMDMHGVIQFYENLKFRIAGHAFYGSSLPPSIGLVVPLGRFLFEGLVALVPLPLRRCVFGEFQTPSDEDLKMQNYGNHIHNISGKLLSFMRIFLFSIISFGPIPNHIAFIMDGNRRYAKKQTIEQNIGYRKGFSALLPVLQYSFEMGVKYVTVYAFSIDNFKRRSDEVQSLMELMKEKIDELSKKESIVTKYGIRINFWGDLKLLNESVRLAAEELMVATAENTGPVLSMCVAYTSTCEIIHAVQEFCSESRSYHLQGAHSKGLVSVADLEQHLYTVSCPAPDIVVRTSGETRLSNFLLWQTAYSHLQNPVALWPDFSLWHFVWAILQYQRVYPYLQEKKIKSE